MSHLELRHQFAGMAMASIMSSVGTSKDARARLYKLADENKLHPSEQVAKMSYEQADRMLLWDAKHPFTA